MGAPQGVPPLNPTLKSFRIAIGNVTVLLKYWGAGATRGFTPHPKYQLHNFETLPPKYLQMNIRFRECDWFNLWIWLEFKDFPTEREKQLIDEVFNSWFLLGKLGGFNAINLQVQESGLDISDLDYELAADDMMSVMHNMGDVEYEDCWARCWVDLGTADAIALDVLINALQQFSQDYVNIEQIIIGGQVGGQNQDWHVDT